MYIPTWTRESYGQQIHKTINWHPGRRNVIPNITEEVKLCKVGETIDLIDP